MTGIELSRFFTTQLVELENTDSPRYKFHVHQAVVDELCHPLCDELRGYWRVFDAETVGRFAQYLYQADWDCPAPSYVWGTASGGPTHLLTPPVNSGDDATNASDYAGELRSDTLNPTRPLTPLSSYKIPKLQVGCIWLPWRPMRTPFGYSYENVFLPLAKLYILSYSQGIHALSDECIARLHNKLKGIHFPQIAGDVAKLLRYVYHTPRDSIAPPKPLQPAWTELQNLVTQFCALSLDIMNGNPEFTALLGEGGPLATDIAAKIFRCPKPAEVAQTTADKEEAPLENENKAADGTLEQQPLALA